MRIYLDNCCLNRPFDDQTHLRIRIEAEAKLFVQDLVREQRLELVWSYVLDYENDANPFQDRREAVAQWKALAGCDVDESSDVVELAERYGRINMGARDALHVACAVVAGCHVFLTTDDGLLAKGDQVAEIRIIDPPAFLRELD